MVKKSHFGDHTVINAGGFQMDNAEKVPYNLNLLFFLNIFESKYQVWYSTPSFK